jgi:hypothetical protein
MGREAVGDEQRRSGTKVGRDRLLVDLLVGHVGRQQRQQAGLARRIRRRRGPEAVTDGAMLGIAAGTGTDDDVESAVAQVARMGPALAAVTDDRNRPALEAVGTCVLVGVDPVHSGFSLVQRKTPAPVGSGGPVFGSVCLRPSAGYRSHREANKYQDDKQEGGAEWHRQGISADLGRQQHRAFQSESGRTAISLQE